MSATDEQFNKMVELCDEARKIADEAIRERDALATRIAGVVCYAPKYERVESGFSYCAESGLHTPHVTVYFPAGVDCNELWVERDRFDDALEECKAKFFPDGMAEE